MNGWTPHLIAPYCDHAWPLLDPNEEDRRNDITHLCRKEPGHEGGHLCGCGARPEDTP